MYENIPTGFHFHVESIKMGFVFTVAEWMETQGLTKQDLAEKLDVPITHLDSFFSGDKHFDFKFLCKLTHLMGYTMAIVPKTDT